jgi:DNA-binding NarL/FixJ family response regulator
MKNEIKVVIADDHPLMRDGLRRAIEATANLKVVAEAGDGQMALDRILSLKPDVAVLDIDMPVMSGFDVARALREKGDPTAIIFLTIHREEDFFNEALDLGAQGYVLKDSAASDIVTGIKAVADGQHFTSPAMTSYLVNRSRRAAEFRRSKPTLNDLTPTERHVLRLIADYKTSKEIADELGVSHRTIETHRANISAKLELRGSHSRRRASTATDQR